MESTSAAGGNVTQATFLQFVDEYSDVDQAVAQAVGMRKDLRKRIRGAGLNLAAFDRSRAEAEKSGDKREEEDREFRRNMAWLGKPIGFQADWVGAPSTSSGPRPNGEDTAAVAEHQVHQVEAHGEAAGEAGRERGANPWSPGTLLYQTWDTAWMAGQETLARKLGPAEALAPRKRGRPPGARNKPKPGVSAAGG
jgi:hypothetical protein